MAPRVLITDYPWGDVAVERGIIEAAGFAVATGPATVSPPEAIAALAREHDPVAIMTCWAPVPAEAITAPTDLRIVARMGVGLDNIDVAAATARGAVVTNVPDYCVEEVSDHALALILAHVRSVPTLDREVKDGKWLPGGAKVGRMAALTVGLVGFGRIGRLIAKKLAGFGCRILAHSRAATDAPDGVERADLATIRAEADVIVLTVPLTDATRHMVDDSFIAACARRPLIVNVSRGGLIDNDALLRGLDSGRLAGVALDVVEGEPNPPRGLVERPDVIATPHVGFLSPLSLLDLRNRAAAEVVGLLRGAPPLFPCNAPASRDQALTGGVSSDIRLVDTVLGPVVVKSALAELRVAAHWPSDPSRSMIEADALAAIARLIGAQHVPQVLWTDPARNCFGMARADPRLRNWKADLMAGRVDQSTAREAGRLLGRLHARSATDPEIAERFASQRFFEELRIRPYFERVAEANPALASAIYEAIAAMRTAEPKALVHGDYSPKNILADGADLMLLDCEVAHWGDPRFDLAFLLSHLLLKAERWDADRAALLNAARAVLTGYAEEGPRIDDASSSSAQRGRGTMRSMVEGARPGAALDEMRRGALAPSTSFAGPPPPSLRDVEGTGIDDALLVRLVGILVLARLDGDSPVEYRADLDRPAVKARASALIAAPAPSMSAVLQDLA